MNNKETMKALIEGKKICNPNWSCKFTYMTNEGKIYNDKGENILISFSNNITGKTKIYKEGIDIIIDKGNEICEKSRCGHCELKVNGSCILNLIKNNRKNY